MTLEQKRATAERLLASFGRAVVAFSGGVDSTLLARMACNVLGRVNVLAVTADSPSMAREDLLEAKRLAQTLDVPHAVIGTNEVERADYRANTAGRCFICKQVLFEELNRLAAQSGYRAVLYGVLADDALSARPGHLAALQYGVRAPLQEAGFEKWDVRELAHQLGLPNWGRPANACLSSRIPHGLAVTEEKLRQVERAEQFLRAQGFWQVRVRHLGGHARIEVDLEDVARFNDPALRLAVEQAFGSFGFSSVGVDRSGYREGGANRADVDEVPLEAIGRC